MTSFMNDPAQSARGYLNLLNICLEYISRALFDYKKMGQKLGNFWPK